LIVAHSELPSTSPDVPAAPYLERRAWIGEYFDRTAAAAWKTLTSDAPVSRVRATVRAGRDTMRHTLLAALPARLDGARVLDAGCGTGVLAMDLARRGASVVAIDLSPTLVDHARERAEADGITSIDFRSGDMLDAALGSFDYAVAMDSLIHYELREILGALAGLAPRVRTRMMITVAPRTPVLAAMHNIGKLFPRHDRAPSIVPVAESKFRRGMSETPALARWTVAGTTRVERGFYRSQALVLQNGDAAKGAMSSAGSSTVRAD
jgi:magnesium-protoporphyrin O-methyltransferase